MNPKACYFQSILVATVLAVFSLIFFNACKKSDSTGAKPPRLVLLYATCTVNKNYLSPYNLNVNYTPAFSRFANLGTVFTKHSTEAGQSGISYASIYTGSQADSHGVYFHPNHLKDDCYLLPEAFDDQGYETFFWDGHPMASHSLGYGQGVKPENTFPRPLIDEGDADFLKILKKLQQNKQYRGFIMTNFTVTHGPYDASSLGLFLYKFPEEQKRITWPEEMTQQYLNIYYDNRLQLQWNFPETVKKLGLSDSEIQNLATAVELLYKSRIWCLDVYFGKIVDQVTKAGLLDESLIVFTADHGEILYRENYPVKWEHGFVMHPDVLDVPMIVYSKALSSKRSRWEQPTRSIDVFPTLIGLCGLSPPKEKGLAGINLTPMLLGSQDPQSLISFSHTTMPLETLREQRKAWTLQMQLFPEIDVRTIWTAVRDQDDFCRWRHFGEGRWDFEAYDLMKDPFAMRNIFDQTNQKHIHMAEQLMDYKQRLVENYRGDSTTGRQPSTGNAEKRLRSLGYME